MDLNSLDIFVSVARRGSFAAVARDLELDPSSVSRTIRNVEAALGMRLFQRTTRTLSLTEEGEVLLVRLEPVLQEFRQAIDDARLTACRPQGTLRITSSVAFGERCLVPLLRAFRETYPDLRLEFLLTDENVDLVSNRIDLAIRLGDGVEGDLVASRWMTTRYRICASPGYLEQRGRPQRPVDLGDHPCLVFSLPDFRTRWKFRDGADETIAVEVVPAMVISNALALRRAAVEGLGPALLADWLVRDDLADGRLVDVFPDHDVAATSFDTGVWFVYPSRAYLPNKVRLMIDYLKASPAR